MCRRSRLQRLERRQRHQPLVVTLGLAAYELYQHNQERKLQAADTTRAIEPPAATQSPAVIAPVQPHTQVRPANDTSGQTRQRAMPPTDAAPPSYEESVGNQQRNAARSSPPQGDVKRRPLPASPQDRADDSSDVSSLFETEGVMTPTTEMDTHQDRPQNNDLLAQATRSLSLQDGKQQARTRSPQACNPATAQGNVQAARISSIAQWLSEHDGPSETRGVPQDRPAASNVSRPSQQSAPAASAPRQDSFETYWQQYPEHRPEALGMSRRETKLAIKAAYREEKRTIKAEYKSNKESVKAQKKQMKRELKDMKHSLK